MTENIQAAETAVKTQTARKRVHRKQTEKEEIITAIFMASEMAVRLENMEISDIQSYVYKMMALTKYSDFFTRPCVKFIVDKAEQFAHSVREKSITGKKQLQEKGNYK